MFLKGDSKEPPDPGKHTCFYAIRDDCLVTGTRQPLELPKDLYYLHIHFFIHIYNSLIYFKLQLLPIVDHQNDFNVAQVCCHYNCSGLGPCFIFKDKTRGNLYKHETSIFMLKGDWKFLFLGHLRPRNSFTQIMNKENRFE